MLDNTNRQYRDILQAMIAEKIDITLIDSDTVGASVVREKML